MIDALLDLMRAGGGLGALFAAAHAGAFWLGLLAALLVYLGRPAGSTLAKTVPILAVVGSTLWLPLVVFEVRRGIEILHDESVAVGARSAPLSQAYSAAMYTLALGLASCMLSVGAVLAVRLVQARKHPEAKTEIWPWATALAICLYAAKDINPLISHVIRAFAAVAFAEPDQKDALVRASVLEIQPKLAAAHSTIWLVSGAAILGGLALAWDGGKRDRPVSWATTCLAGALLSVALWSYAVTRSFATDAAQDFPAHRPLPFVAEGMLLPQVTKCPPMQRPADTELTVRWDQQGLVHGRVLDAQDFLDQVRSSTRTSPSALVVTIVAGAKSALRGSSQQLSLLADTGARTVTISELARAPFKVETQTAGTLSGFDYCAVPLSAEELNSTTPLQELLKRARPAQPQNVIASLKARPAGDVAADVEQARSKVWRSVVEAARAKSAVELEEHCVAGRPRACVERALQEPAQIALDTLHAQCSQGRPLACVHEAWTRLEAGTAPAMQLFDALQDNCKLSNEDACALVGWMQLAGTGTLPQVAQGIAALEMACDNTSAVGCAGVGLSYELELYPYAAPAAKEAAYARACTAGLTWACARRNAEAVTK